MKTAKEVIKVLEAYLEKRGATDVLLSEVKIGFPAHTTHFYQTSSTRKNQNGDSCKINSKEYVVRQEAFNKKLLENNK